MQVSKTARRYASALLQLADEQGVVEELLEDARLINATLEESRDLVLMLKSPIVKTDDKQSVLEEVFKPHVQELTHLYLKLITRKNRENLLDQIFAGFIDAYYKYAGIVRVGVTASTKLEDAQESQLKKALEERTGKTVEMSLTVDESVRGGISVRIEDTVIDATIQHKLDQLEQRFMSTAV